MLWSTTAQAEDAPLLGGSEDSPREERSSAPRRRQPLQLCCCAAALTVCCTAAARSRQKEAAVNTSAADASTAGTSATAASAAASPSSEPRGRDRERMAVTLAGWIGTTVHDGGLGIRTHVIDPLAADVFLALTYDKADGCGGASPPPSCRASRLLPALYGGAAPPRVHVSLSPSLSTARLLRVFKALPHWPEIVASHNAKGSAVACPPTAANATPAGGYACVGLFKGNSFFAPVLGDPAIHNLHQLRALSLALQLVAKAERKQRWRFGRLVHTRLDLQWLRRHPPVRLLSPAHAWVPDGEDYYGGLNDRHAVLNRSQAEVYYGRWDALLDGRVLEIEPQLRARRVERGIAMSNEHLLMASLAHHRVSVRRFPSIAHLKCCDRREMCFADARYYRNVPVGLNATSGGPQVCGKYAMETERAVQHALALIAPGARYAARVASATGEHRYRLDAAPADAAAADLVIAVPLAQRAAFRSALERLKRRWYAVDSELIVFGRIAADGAGFAPAALKPSYTLARPFRAGKRPRPRARAAKGYCAPTEDDVPGDCVEGHKGMWRMGPGRPITDLNSCADFCYRVCPRCRFVSASRRNRDCSWFNECDLTKLHLEWYGDSFRTVVVAAM